MTFTDREEQNYRNFYKDYSEDDILPCPFCGDRAGQIGRGSGKRGVFFYINCDNCYGKCGTSSRVEGAVRNWNQRAG